MSAYELIQYIDERHVNKVLKISKQATYKSCKRLFANKQIDGEAVQEGNAPEKVVYTINEKGKKYFMELMEQYATGMEKIYFNFNTFIYNLEKLDYAKGLELLERMQTEFTFHYEHVVRHEKEAAAFIPFSSRMIVKKYRMIMQTLVQWITETLEEYVELNR